MIEPQSGYEMKKMIETSIAHFWDESNGQIYPTLKKLFKEDLIRLEEKKSKKKIQKLIYSITDKGIIELENWLKFLPNKNVHRDEGLLKLFFGGSCPENRSLSLLAHRKKTLAAKLKEYRRIEQTLKTNHRSRHYKYWLMALKNGIFSIQAELKWCKECIRILNGEIRN